MVTAGRSFLRRAAAILGAAAILVTGMTPTASASPSLDSIINTSPNIYGAARDIINALGIPGEISDVLNKGIGFLAGEGGGEPGFNVPDQAPKTNQLLLPTVTDKCIGGEDRSFGLATTAPDPAGLPLPGVPENRLGSIFTNLGTRQLTKEQNIEMNIYRVSIANGKYDKATLENNDVDTEEGPGTINGTADTGKNLVIAVIQSSITTQGEPGPTGCNYIPTAGIFPIGLN